MRSTGRTLVVTNDFAPRRGGIESYVQAFCAALPADRVVVYTATMPGQRETDERLPYPVVRDPSRVLLPTPAVAHRVTAAMGRHGCDQVVFGAAAPLGLLGAAVRRAGARRVVAMTHGHETWWARLPVTRQALRRIVAGADVVTHVSAFSRDELRRAWPRQAAPALRSLSPGIDTDRFRPGRDGTALRREWGVEAGRPVVLAASRLVPRKGQDLLVEGWPQVLRRHPAAVLAIVGDGPHAASLRRQVAAQGVSGSVLLVPGVAWDLMPDVYAAADVFALPCRTRRAGLEPEALGIAYLEAAASGLPVVVGRSGGAPETVLDGRSGHVVDPRDAAATAHRVAGLLDDPQRARAFGLAGRELVLKRFSRARFDAGVRGIVDGVSPGTEEGRDH